MLSFRIFRIAMFTYSKGQSCVPGQPDPSSLCTSEIQTETLLKSRITLIPNCRVPDDCIDASRHALFVSREVMRDLIERFRSPAS